MTAQVPEILIHRGTHLDMTEDPLRGYLDRLPKIKRPNMIWQSSACWRGYVGTWEFRDSCLCLVALQTVLLIDGREVEGNLEMALPWVKGCLRASWFTGRLRCPEGRMLHYAHNMFASDYERDRFLFVHKGRLKEEYIQVNPPESLLYRIDAGGGRQFVDSFRDADGLPDPLEGHPLTDAYLVWGQKPEEVPEEEQGYRIGGAFVRGPGSPLPEQGG